MKKARANTNDYWDKKLLEVEEKDPNRWRHTGYKKMYIQGESSSGESDREGNFRYNAGGAGPSGGGGGGGGGVGGGPSALNGRIGGPGMYHRPSRSPRSRSRSRLRKSPPLSPQMRRRSPVEHGRRMSPPPQMDRRPRSPEPGRRIMPPRSPQDMGGRRPGPRPRSPPEPLNNARRVKSPPRSPMGRRRSPGGMPPARRHSPAAGSSMPPNKRGQILPRSKRPPSPPPRNSCRSRSNSSVSSCSDDSCSVCSPKHHRQYSRSTSLSRPRPAGGPRSPPPKRGPPGPPISRPPMQYRGVPPNTMPSSSRVRPSTPPQVRGEKYREEKLRRISRERSRDMIIERPPPESSLQMARAPRHSPPEDPRLKNRPPEPMEQVVPKKKKKESNDKLVRTRIKIEGEKRKKHGSSSESDDSGSDSESSLPTFTATTRLTLSERFGKMAQWSIDRSNMENMRITKDSTGGALKVMIEEGLESPPRRYSYSPAPAGHFPEELATTAPSGMLSWDDVRVRYEYYKNRGYLRDLDLKDYIKWEEWWYKYQEWLKQERYYEFWERQQMHRRRRKKIPIAQRLN
ncbi:WAS/WASL-interacting protein family member 1 isoform X2 [Eupeodes corollae]|nr:WAS/WASL-interacting protein family member 1 isoform X2 [Eupeodes corollae]